MNPAVAAARDLLLPMRSCCCLSVRSRTVQLLRCCMTPTHPVHMHTGKKHKHTSANTLSSTQTIICMPENRTYTHAASSVYMHAPTKAQHAGETAWLSSARCRQQPTRDAHQPAASTRTAGCQQRSRHLLLHRARRAAARTKACAARGTALHATPMCRECGTVPWHCRHRPGRACPRCW